MRRSLQALVALLLLAAAGVGLWRAWELDMLQPARTTLPVRVTVRPGEGLRAILSQVAQQGALRHPRLAEWYLRLHGVHARVAVGTYEFAPHANAQAVLEQLLAGRVVLESLTVVEGWTFRQMRAALDAHPALQHTLQSASDAAVMQALGHGGENAEGRFFPDTYRFATGTSDRRILELAYQRMRDELARDWTAREADLPLNSPDQALILASIVEKETGQAQERPLVAAVFVNRLRLGMRLQSDPTVIYGLGEHYDGSIHSRDLSTDTPYNTYTRAGLPPTPIALPGAASLEAVLHPAMSAALYFVAVGDGSGRHVFSSTLEQHDVALRAYLQRLGVKPPPATTPSGHAP